MNPREQFLTTLFASLDAKGIRYCLLRNYENLYTADDTDVDILVSPTSFQGFKQCLRAAAAHAQFRFVHAARYVNYSHVFWHPDAGFTRIDFETDVRWTVFTVLSTTEVLDARIRRAEFFIPAPWHESAILFTAAVWRGFLSERYRRQLARLYEACTDKSRLHLTLQRAFGRFAGSLLDAQAQASTGAHLPLDFGKVRRSIVVQSLCGGKSFVALVRNIGSEFPRLWERLRLPTGISLLLVSAGGRKRSFEDLMSRIEFLFPSKKCFIRRFSLTNDSNSAAGWGAGLRWQRLRTLFKGGLFLRAIQLPRDADLPPFVRWSSPFLYASRTFFCLEDANGRLYFAHIKLGFMATVDAEHRNDGSDFQQAFVSFVSDMLERQTGESARKKPARGAFCVLLGLDGAGKTTLARNLCQMAATTPQFRGVRYFHWLPKLGRKVELPLPEFREHRRKNSLSPGPLSAVMSVARVIKNLIRANLGYWLHVRPLIRRGYLVLADRYFYNYILAPASVKYYAPPGLLKTLLAFFPKPDLVVKLVAPMRILLQRKQELSEAEIARQSSVLNGLECDGATTVEVDSGQPAPKLAETVMRAISKAADSR